ncbi:alkaline phosphatase family protein [Shewanella sp. D64]|uniref:alkaline phosphatase family protein n=1 Tax=unclassified Shewanella TaxID=196818 RepID=UPI0022BA42A2|nr:MULTISPECIES: alkaline phosphatase family protein [unclassified Shewanella]MEC4726106.1 alkaline phosphatase family protein [Shewanella sp. D64]MEC4737978.1 alkaline phosphatase family protein [Shewanella sp. E94]WBJ96177.1 alkaline phosphatase family protein [Shewanella sp. MTB7]
MEKLINTPMGRLSRCLYLILALISLPSAADIGDTPVIGGVFNASEIMRDQIVSSLSASTKLTRDITLFTIAGVSLDVYILTLPLDSKVKASVIAQLSDPTYAIPLGHFLYSFYDQYTGVSADDEFKQYLNRVYSSEQLKDFEHSLYQYGDKLTPEDKQTSGEQDNSQGIKTDSRFIPSMVTIYDALVEIGEWQDMDALPHHYTYLTQSPTDLALIGKIQPIIVELMVKATGGMEAGEMKAALQTIIEDGKPEHRNRVDNKAQALTITLIDFVRLNVLKAYRQFVFKQEREEALNAWMQDTFDESPDSLIQFLTSQQERRYGVQVAVDGLQQGLLEGLIDPSTPFIKHANQIHESRTSFKPKSGEVKQPEHEQQVKFMGMLAKTQYDDPHYLPFFKQLYKTNRDSIAQVGISSTPTISVRNLPIIKTGAKVSGERGTGIPNFHFVDREEDRAYYFFGNDALQLDRLMESSGVQTMFDRLAYLITLNCNAQYDWNAHTSFDGLVNLGLGEVQRDYGEKRCLRELKDRAKVEVKLRQFRQGLIEDIQGYQGIYFLDIFTKLTKKWKIEQRITELASLDGQGMPDFTLIYNPWPDHFAHFTGPFSDEIIMPTGELNRLDYWLSRTELVYKEAGIYDQTLWGMAGDHGLTPVFYALNPEKSVFSALSEELGYPILVKKISSDEGEGPKITNALNYSSNKGVDILVASTAGGNMMMDLFNSALGWKVQPTYKELIRWTAINATDPSQTIDIVAETVNRLADSLDYMVLREQQCRFNQCQIRLIGYRDGVRLDELVELRGDKLLYTSVSVTESGGAEPDIEPKLLDIQTLNPYREQPTAAELNKYSALKNRCLHQAKEQEPESWCSVQQWRALTRFTLRPDAVNQVARLYEEDRAGTINLFPKAGIGFNTKVPGRHAGEDYLEKDAFIGFWGAPIGDAVTPLTIEENGSLAPTIYEFLTGEAVVPGKNGWGYPSLLEKLDVQ